MNISDLKYFYSMDIVLGNRRETIRSETELYELLVYLYSYSKLKIPRTPVTSNNFSIFSQFVFRLNTLMA